MREDVDIGGIKIPVEEWEATPERIKQVLQTLVQQLQDGQGKLEQLGQRVTELEEQQRRNSKNSSQPPSKDEVGEKGGKGVTAKVKRNKPLKFRRVEEKRERELYAPQACRAVYEVKPELCKGCGEPLGGEDSRPYRHQVVDLPEIKPDVVEYRLHQLECEHCGAKTRASLPQGVSERCYGSRVAGWIGLASVEYRQSHRQVQGMLREGFGIELSRGSISRARQEVSESVAAAVEQAHAYVQQQPAVHCDETSFTQGNQDGHNPNQRQGWLWVLVSPLVSVFMVALSRSQATAQQLLGATFSGTLISERHSSYSWVDPQHLSSVGRICCGTFRPWPSDPEFPKKLAEPCCGGATVCFIGGIGCVMEQCPTSYLSRPSTNYGRGCSPSCKPPLTYPLPQGKRPHWPKPFAPVFSWSRLNPPCGRLSTPEVWTRRTMLLSGPEGPQSFGAIPASALSPRQAVNLSLTC